MSEPKQVGAEPTPLSGGETSELRDAFRARPTQSPWCGYAVPQDGQDGALAFLFTEGGHGGPYSLFRTQAGGYALATHDGLVVWTGKAIEDVPAAFKIAR